MSASALLRTACVAFTLGLLASAASGQTPERLLSARDGGTGGLAVAAAGGARPGSFRLQLALEAAPADDFLRRGVELTQTRKAISFSWTALETFELYASLHDRDTASTATTTGVVASDLGSLHLTRGLLGMKVHTDAVRYVKLGGDLRLIARGDAGSEVALLKATSVGLRAIAATDLRELPRARHVPLLVRFNAEYLLDNAARAVEGTEEVRYRGLEDPLPRRDETAHLLTASERYGLDVSRVDRFSVALGVELPLAPVPELRVQPILEWQLSVPVNRQGYDCPAPLDPASSDDVCVSDADAVPMTLGVGVRVAPPIRGFSFLLALEADLTDDEANHVRELAPAAPFLVTLALGYDD
jgi:hypothetical protein